MNLDGNALRQAYSRDGNAADNRPDSVDDVMSERETVGFEEEEPLLDKEYQNYHKNDSLLLPRAGEDLVTLASHELISDVNDMASELGSREDKVETALSVHGIDPPDGRDVRDTERLHALVADVPERFITTESPVLVAHLYVSLGLSVEEIAEVLSKTMDDHKTVAQNTVTQCLVDAQVLPGETSTSAKKRRKNARGEINRASNGGISISAEDW